MEKQETGLSLNPTFETLAERLNNSVLSVLHEDAGSGFKKAFLTAIAITQLKELLAPEYMKPIMQMQGNRLGFKTDKDRDGGYPEDVVKSCLIEAVLMGLEVTGNQFNIIAGNTYATKEGMGYLLKKIPGLTYDITPELPRMNDKGGAVVMNINWSLNGIHGSKKMDIPVKVNSFMGADAVIGKATRKARKWLYDTITGCEIPEGDAIDTDAEIVSSKINKSPDNNLQITSIENKETERILLLISDCKTIADLKKIEKHIVPEAKEMYDAKLIELTSDTKIKPNEAAGEKQATMKI